MKTKVEIEGFEIEIEFENGVISVKAEKDDEVIEEFTIETEGEVDSDEDSDEVKGFDEFGEEEDFGDEDMDSDDEDSDDEDNEDLDDVDDINIDDMDSDDDEEEKKGEAQLESFQSFINKKRK